MPYSTSRRTREKRLRAYYRRKIWTVAIIMLVIGLVLGFAAVAAAEVLYRFIKKRIFHV